jgi:phage terminase Nu1 subunit (DNA packaging protein)
MAMGMSAAIGSPAAPAANAMPAAAAMPIAGEAASAGDEAEEAPIFLTREEAAALHKVSLPTLDRWIRSGGEQFVAEWGGNGRPYKIDPEKLRAWRECRATEEADEERRRQARLAQMEMELVGGNAGEGGASGGMLSAEQRIKLWQEQLLANKVRRERGELVEVGRAEQAYENRLKLVADFLRGLPDVLARRLGWDAETTAACAESVEAIQERLARMLMEERFLD